MTMFLLHYNKPIIHRLIQQKYIITIHLKQIPGRNISLVIYGFYCIRSIVERPAPGLESCSS